MVAAGGRINASDINEAIDASAEKPMCVLRKGTVTSVANNSTAALLWDAEDLDTHGWHNNSSNTSRITPTKAGWIRITATVTFSGNTTGRRGIVIRFNGSSTWWGTTFIATSSANVTVTVTVSVPANGSGDYFEVGAFQDSGGALNTADTTSTRFEAEWLRDL